MGRMSTRAKIRKETATRGHARTPFLEWN
jgi:hypothetical protein